MFVHLSVVQPIAHPPSEAERNVEDAINYIERAAENGASVVAFPESYPGPWRMPAEFNPCEAMQEAASQFGVYVQFGTLEPTSSDERSAYQVSALAAPGGTEPQFYRRTHPHGPWIYNQGGLWDFDYVAGDEFPVFATAHGIVGLEVCSEVYVPEISRILALNGAEILFIPAGGPKRRLWETWRNLIWARASENLAVVVTTQNLFSPSEKGLAMVAGPESVIFETTSPGMFTVQVDLERVRDLRAGVDTEESRNATKAGLLTQWRRPDLFPAQNAPVDKRALASR
jgi:predicted amidohydrolase